MVRSSGCGAFGCASEVGRFCDDGLYGDDNEAALKYVAIRPYISRSVASFVLCPTGIPEVI